MPSGKTHLRIEAALLLGWAAAGCSLIVIGVLRVAVGGAFLAAYVFSMLLLSPDLDLRRSRPFRRWGPLRVLWWPYAVVFRHRRASHHWLIGPATRILYVTGWGGVMWFALARSGWCSNCVGAPNTAIVAAIVAGLYVPNLTHIVADRVSTIAARRRHPKSCL